MIDEVAHKGCKNPVIAAVSVEIGNRHRSFAVPASSPFGAEDCLLMLPNEMIDLC